jgi:hypothetical protein
MVLVPQHDIPALGMQNSILWCTSCGGYAWKDVNSFAEERLGRKCGPSLKQQRKLLLDGHFPRRDTMHKTWRITQGTTPSIAQIAWLFKRNESQRLISGCHTRTPQERAFTSETQLLRHYGLTDASIPEWAPLILQLEARHQQRGDIQRIRFRADLDINASDSDGEAFV